MKVILWFIQANINPNKKKWKKTVLPRGKVIGLYKFIRAILCKTTGSINAKMRYFSISSIALQGRQWTCFDCNISMYTSDALCDVKDGCACFPNSISSAHILESSFLGKYAS